MNSKIQKIYGLISEKLKIDFSMCDIDGAIICGKALDVKNAPIFDNEIYQDEVFTWFKARINGKNCIGNIKAVGQAGINYAVIILNLIEEDKSSLGVVSRAEFCRAILLGETTSAQAETYMRKYSLKDRPCFVMIISVLNGVIEDVKDVLDTYGESNLDFVIDMGSEHLAFIKFVGEEDGDYSSSSEYAQFLSRSIYEETGKRVKINIGGTVGSMSELSLSYTQAMTAVRMSATLNTAGNVHTFKEYAFYQMIEDLPKYKLKEYLDALSDARVKELLADKEIVKTADEFLENNLNMSETARKLYLHRNTLSYRLDKIESCTGLDIRRFSDAVTFRLITVLNKLVR